MHYYYYRNGKRKINHYIRWLFLVAVLTTLIISGAFLARTNQISSDLTRLLTAPRPSTTSVVLSTPPSYHHHVTKSLNELGKMDEINSYALFLNCVPHSGAELLVFLLQKLQGFNNFKHVRLVDADTAAAIVVTRSQQEELVYKMYDVIRNGAIPFSFDRHVNFINFTSFDRQSPTFINLIREPFDQFLSRLVYYNNDNKTDDFIQCIMLKGKKGTNCSRFRHSYDLNIPYFCGYDPRCFLLNNHWALQTAKSNIERYYPVVGVLDELNVTLQVFENKIPYYFRGVQSIYEQDLLYTYNHRKNKQINLLNSKRLKFIQKRLKATLSHEYDFYAWIKTRLFGQLQQ